MAILNDERKPELLTPIERAWLDLLRTAMAASTSGAITFQEVNVRDGRAWAMRIIETIHCGVSAHAVKR